MSISSLPTVKSLTKLDQQIKNGQFVEAKYSFKPGPYRTYDQATAQLFGQRIVGTKTRGVEPGFIAKKEWSDKDKQNLFNKDHKFHKEALSFLNVSDETAFKNLLADPAIYEQVVKHLVDHFLKFKKKHFWKLHYSEPDLLGRVSVDFAQSKGRIHQQGTADTPRGKNLGALVEQLANDIYTILGFEGQKYSLRLARYKDGYPMFLLDGTEVFGPNGEPFQTLDKEIVPGPSWQGRIRDNLVLDPKTGKKVPLDEKKLGSSFLKALLMIDRDKVGDTGGNLGYVVVNGKAVLMNIDPGKSLEDPNLWQRDRMGVCDLESDCLFDPALSPSNVFTGGYKNFSIFNDTSLADRVQGMKDIIEKWPEVEKLFECYIQFFKDNEKVLDPNKPKNTPSMHQVIHAHHQRLLARVKMFKQVLRNRTKVEGPWLNLLDNLEKLIAPTTQKAPISSGTIDLKYPRIIDPKRNRVEWFFEKVEGKNLLTFEAKDQQEFSHIMDILYKFMFFVDKNCEPFFLFNHTTVSRAKGVQGQLHFNDEAALMKMFSLENIIAYKAQKKEPLFTSPQQASSFLVKFAGFAATNPGFNGEQLAENLNSILRLLKEGANSPAVGSTVQTLGLLAGRVQPAFAAISLCTTIIGFVRRSQTPLPFSKEVLFEALNQCLTPVIKNAELALENYKSHDPQAAKHTSNLLAALQVSHSRLAQLLKAQGNEIRQGFSDAAFNGFIVDSQKAADKFKTKAAKCAGRDSEFLRLCESTLCSSRGYLAHGFIGKSSRYPLEWAAENPLYCTGLIYRTLTGDSANPPPELNLLDTVAYTFCHKAQSCMGNREEAETVASQLLNGTQEQLKLFGQLPKSLQLLQESHSRLIKQLQDNIKAAGAKKPNKSEVLKKWTNENIASVTTKMVGQKMFYWSKLVHSNMNLFAFTGPNDGLAREIMEGILLLLTIWNSEPEKWIFAAAVTDQKLCKLSIQNALRKAEGLKITGLDSKSNARLERVIWWDKNGFHSNIVVTTPSRLPFSILPRITKLGDTSSPPAKPVLACKLIYQVNSSEFEVQFEKDSRLKAEDIRGIKALSTDEVYDRAKFIQSLLNEMATLPSESICQPLDAKFPPLVFPPCFIDHHLYSLCPELDKLLLLGEPVELRYDFKESGGIYRLSLHVLYQGKPYRSKCIFECDAVTVQSYADTFHNEAPELTEFLFCALYQQEEGFPGKDTYINKKNGVIAPIPTPFPGIHFIFKKAPKQCFRFDHKQYDFDASQRLWDFCVSGKAHPSLDRFFMEGEMSVDENNYIAVQDSITQRCKDLEESAAYKDFKKYYDLFIAHAKLVSKLDEASIRKLLEYKAKIIAPGEVGLFEQAFDYCPPVKEDLQTLLTQLEENPSIAKTNLLKYEKLLNLFIGAIGRNSPTDALKARYLQEVLDVMQKENSPFDPSYSLEKETFPKIGSPVIEKKAPSPIRIEAPRVESTPPPAPSMKRIGSFTYSGQTYDVAKTVGDGACAIHALLGNLQAGEYFCPEARQLYVNALKKAAGANRVLEVIATLLKDHLEAPNIDTKLIFDQIDKDFRVELDERDQKLKKLNADRENLIKQALADKICSPIIHNLVKEPTPGKVLEDIDTVLAAIIDQDIGQKLSLLQETILKEEDVREDSFINFARKAQEAYYTAATNCNYNFSTAEIGLMAHLFDRCVTVFSKPGGKIQLAFTEGNPKSPKVEIYQEGHHFSRCVVSA